LATICRGDKLTGDNFVGRQVVAGQVVAFLKSSKLSRDKLSGGKLSGGKLSGGKLPLYQSGTCMQRLLILASIILINFPFFARFGRIHRFYYV
jgi:hypothetical protein